MRYAILLIMLAGCFPVSPKKPAYKPKVRPAVKACQCGCGKTDGCICPKDDVFGQTYAEDCPIWKTKPPPEPDSPPTVRISDEQMDEIAGKVGEMLSHALKVITLQQPEPTPLLPVTWNPELFTMSAFPVANIEPKQFRLYAPKWCKHCPAAVAALPGDAEIEVKVIDGTIPGLKQVPCLVDVAANVAYYGDDIASMTALRKRLGMKEQPVGFSLFNLGTIKRDDLINSLAMLNDTDSCPSLGNREHVIEQDGATVTIPAKFGVTWKSEGAKRFFTFTRPVAAKWGLLSTTLTGMTWEGGNKITVSTGSRLMQGTITVEE